MSRSVLIVDDEQHIRLLIEQTLEELLDEGVELYTASDGEEALAAIEAQSPDLVFLDVMMPKRNGLEVARAVRDELGKADTHIVLLTAKGQAVDREAGLAAGANRYLTKPFDPDELLGIAHEVLGSA
jgi:two-component system, OmpR family, alkaline phosphatase synthesis response regulator PhoP